MARVRLVVEYFDGVFEYFPIETQWRVDPRTNQIVIGRGLPRKYIPLINVRNYDIEEVK